MSGHEIIWKVEMTAPSTIIPALEEILIALADSEDFPTTSNFEIIEGEEDRLLQCFYNIKPDLDRLTTALNLMAENLGSTADLIVTLEEVPNEDWVSASQKLLSPVDTGKFFIYGGHDADKIKKDAINIRVEAGQAFGTGQHETTYGCLKAIGDLSDVISPALALDLGCGSGVLALAMAKQWNNAKIIASDIDAIATETTVENAIINDVPMIKIGENASGLVAITSDGFEDPQLNQNGSFDLIVANILAKPLQILAGDITDHLKDDGYLILSGLLDVQEGDVLASYTAKGWGLKKSYAFKEWRALLLIKNN